MEKQNNHEVIECVFRGDQLYLVTWHPLEQHLYIDKETGQVCFLLFGHEIVIYKENTGIVYYALSFRERYEAIREEVRAVFPKANMQLTSDLRVGEATYGLQSRFSLGGGRIAEVVLARKVAYLYPVSNKKAWLGEPHPWIQFAFHFPHTNGRVTSSIFPVLFVDLGKRTTGTTT